MTLRITTELPADSLRAFAALAWEHDVLRGDHPAALAISALHNLARYAPAGQRVRLRLEWDHPGPDGSALAISERHTKLHTAFLNSAELLAELATDFRLPLAYWNIFVSGSTMEGQIWHADGPDRRRRSLDDLGQWAAILGVPVTPGYKFAENNSEQWNVDATVREVPVRIWTNVPVEGGTS